MVPLLSLNENLAIEEQPRGRRQIDETIQSLQFNILSLKSQRNALSPLYRLPPEIIHAIILYVKEGVVGYTESSAPQWIGLTHVSHHLRNIAVNSPALWADPPLDNLHWMEEMLKRSKGAGVNIEIRSQLQIHPAVALALQHGAQLKTLSFSEISPGAWNDLLHCLPESAPLLETLVIGTLAYYSHGYTSHSVRVSTIPKEILRETKRLQRLEVQRCDFNWFSPSHVFQSLTQLSIMNPSEQSRPTVQEFTDALKRMTNLECLTLLFALPVQTDKRASWSSDHIHLPYLQRMELYSTPAELEGFFSCVTFPPRATVMVETTFTSSANTIPAALTSNKADFSGLISGLSRSYTNLTSDQVFQTIKLSQSGPSLRCEFPYQKPTATNPWNPPNLTLTFGGIVRSRFTLIFPSPLEVKAIFNALFGNGMPLQHIQQVHLLGLIPGYNADMIARTVGTLPEVSFVRAVEDAAKLFIDALNLPSTPGRKRSVGNTLFFPRLTSFCLRNARIDASVADILTWRGTTIRELQECPIRRRESGLEITKLALERCRNLSQQNVNLFTQIVGNVDWDGQEILEDA